MSFTATELYHMKTVNGSVVVGKYVNTAGSTGGTIYPSLSLIEAVNLQPVTTAVVTSFPVVNVTIANMPYKSSTGITIVTTSNESGFYTMYGV